MSDLRTRLRVLWCEITAGALVLTGDVSLGVSVAILVLIPVVGLSRPDAAWRVMARRVSSVTTFAYLMFLPIDWFFLSGRLIFAIVHLTFYLKLHTLLHQESPRERSRLHLLCLFEMLAAASMTVDAFFAVPLALFLIVGAMVLMLEQTRPESVDPRMFRGTVRTAFAVVLPLFVIAAAIFVALPRVSSGGFRLGGITGITVTGFSETVRLGDFEEIRRDNDVVMRAIADESQASPPRWRGPAYDRYEDGAWRQSLSGVFSLPQPGEGRYLLDRPAEGPFAQNEVFVEPLDTDVLFLPPASESIVTPERYVFVDPYLTLRTGRRARAGRRYAVSWRYRAGSDTSPVGGIERLSSRRRELYTQLPELSPRVHDLAASIAPDEAGTELAERLEQYLKSTYGYTLQQPRRVNDEPLEDFLFESKAGHCEYFATALVVLLRARDVPSRLVTGFNRGQRNAVGEFEVIRKTNAHAWVEVFDDDRGWIAFDPTPPSPDVEAARAESILSQGIDSLRMLWDMYVVAFDVERQRGVLGTMAALGNVAGSSATRALGLVRQHLLSILVFAGSGLLVWLVSKSRWFERLKLRVNVSARAPSPVAFYENLLALLGRVGVDKGETETPFEFARDRETDLPGLTELTAVYYRVRFGGRTLSKDEERRVRTLAAAIGLAALSDGRRQA